MAKSIQTKAFVSIGMIPLIILVKDLKDIICYLLKENLGNQAFSKNK
jgi:hypothetical protein